MLVTWIIFVVIVRINFFIYTTNYFSVVLRITFPMCIENYFFIGPRINFRGIANLFFVLQYIAVLAVHFENFARGGVFAKRIPRRNIVGERNERGFHIFLQNLKGVLSSMQKWWGFLDRGFDRGDYAERLQNLIVHISAQMTSPFTCKHELRDWLASSLFTGIVFKFICTCTTSKRNKFASKRALEYLPKKHPEYANNSLV